MGKSAEDAKLDEILELLKSGGVSTGGTVHSSRTSLETANIYRLIRAYHSHGHLLADIDPLEMKKHYADNETLKKKFAFPDDTLKSILNYQTYGFVEADLDVTYHVDFPFLGGILSKQKDWKLRDLIEALHNAYCSKIGVEYTHIPDREVRAWIRTRFEGIQYEKLNEN